MTCYQNEYMAICAPGRLKKKVVGRTNKKWCFKCRGYFVHDKVVYSEVLIYDDAGMPINGYYEPSLRINCRNCGEEHIDFGT